MAIYKQGDIVLIPYPYTDLTNSKQRPVVVISKDSINKKHFIVAKITSVIRNDEFSFKLDPSSLDRELKRESEVRTNELFTVDNSLIRKKFATMDAKALDELIGKIIENFSTN